MAGIGFEAVADADADDMIPNGVDAKNLASVGLLGGGWLYTGGRWISPKSISGQAVGNFIDRKLGVVKLGSQRQSGVPSKLGPSLAGEDSPPWVSESLDLVVPELPGRFGLELPIELTDAEPAFVAAKMVLCSNMTFKGRIPCFVIRIHSSWTLIDEFRRINTRRFFFEQAKRGPCLSEGHGH